MEALTKLLLSDVLALLITIMIYDILMDITADNHSFFARMQLQYLELKWGLVPTFHNLNNYGMLYSIIYKKLLI